MRDISLQEVIEALIERKLAHVHTCIVAKVTKVGERTISCTPVIADRKDGKDIPHVEIPDIPVVYPGGSLGMILYPIAIGDYALLFSNEKCIDAWRSGTDFASPPSDRKFDLSDTFALVGVTNDKIAKEIPKVMTIHGDLVVAGRIDVTKDIVADGDIVADLVSLKSHRHTNVKAGTDVTGEPQK